LRDEDAAALGLTRILVVTILTLSLLSHTGAVAEYFSRESPLAGDYARRAFATRWSLFFTVDDPWLVRGIFGVGVVAHVLWLVGLWTTPAALVSFAVWASMVGRNPLLYSLADQLQMALAFLLAAMPTGRGLSLDARRRGPRPVPVWCRRLVQLQVAVMYTGTGLLKSGPTWREDGTALYYAVVNPYNRHFDLGAGFAHLQPWVLRPMTWIVLVWEVAFVAFVVLHWLRESTGSRRVPDLRVAFLGFGAAMHLGIQALLYVAWFTPLCLATYASFLEPGRVRRWLDRRAAMGPREGTE
jgi:hypothetical protein